jgi:hypothetical protein
MNNSMFRLSKSAYNILVAEVRRCTEGTLAGQVQRDIAIKRLTKLCDQQGTPLTLEELRETLNDLFPNFSPSVLQQAARANRPPSPFWNRLKVGTIALTSLVGGVWFLNLPYPMIRYPVARTLPIVLLPSFMAMDHHYRQAIATTEQADQLVNRATSAADLALGKTRIKTAQNHLDALPVWFLGYYPSFYCSWFQCSWRFTLDEFQQARKEVARMDARLFQEQNAQTQLDKSDQTVQTAKRKYQQATNLTSKEAAIADWQQGIDQMREIPRETLAGRLAATKLQAYERDFQQVVGYTLGNVRSGNLIQAAQFAAETARQFSPNKPQSQAAWQEAARHWETASSYLVKIDEKDPDYSSAQKLLSEYQAKLSQVRIRLQQEQQSVQAFATAQQMRNVLFDSVRPGARSLEPAQIQQLHRIIAELQKVQPGTTVYAEAQQWLKSAQAKLKPIGG